MRNVFTQQNKLWQKDLDEKVKIALLIDPSFEEDEKKVRAVKLYRGHKSFVFKRQRNQIPFYHVTKEAELDTFRHNFSLFNNGEFFVMSLDPFTFTPTLEGYYNELWI